VKIFIRLLFDSALAFGKKAKKKNFEATAAAGKEKKRSFEKGKASACRIENSQTGRESLTGTKRSKTLNSLLT